MKPALAAALLGAISVVVTDNHGRPVPPNDPHDTLAVTPDSAVVPKSPLRATLPGRVSFALKFKEEVSPFPIMGMFVMPGEQVPLEAVLTDSTVRYLARAAAGRLTRIGANQWHWTAPQEKGLYPIWVRDSVSGETVTLNAFVLVPMPNAATIGEFMVGRYESRPLRGNPTYARPTGFVEVTEENRGTLVAPHYTIGQFVSKQSSGYPTPFYNRSIGNETRYSRHVYGDAADIYVDDDDNGVMDDLDGDGETTLDDARLLGRMIESLSGKSWYQPFEGGLGLYKANRAHGPFVHVDVRGHPARWGP